MAEALVQKLKTIRSNFSVGLFSCCLLRRLKPEDVTKTDRVIIGEDGLYCIPTNKKVPPEAGNFYEVDFGGSPDFNIDRAAMEFTKMMLRNFTLDSFEAVRRYCDETGQRTKLLAQDWYQFTRMMRNSLTHTQTWHFRDYDRRELPVSWRGKTINESMEGQESDFDFYNWWDGCELWEEINEFAKYLD